MERVKTSIRRLWLRIKRWFSRDRVSFLIAALLCLFWAYNAISATTRNWELEQRLATKRRELTIMQLEVETMELENQYYASEEYQELAAREKQNKIGEGETLVYLPENSDYAKHKNTIVAPTVETPEEPSNIEQWWNFIFGS